MDDIKIAHREITKEYELCGNLDRYGQRMQDAILDCEIDKIAAMDKLNLLREESLHLHKKNMNFIQKHGDIIIYIMFVFGVIFLASSLIMH